MTLTERVPSQSIAGFMIAGHGVEGEDAAEMSLRDEQAKVRLDHLPGEWLSGRDFQPGG